MYMQYFLSYLQSLANTAEMTCALCWMTLILSLMMSMSRMSDLSPWGLPLTGLDCSMMVHSDSWTCLSSASQADTGPD